MRTRPSSSTAMSMAAAHGVLRCRLIGSAICRPIVSDGLSELIGSWKIMAMRLPRIARISSSLNVRRFWPSNTTSPAEILPGGSGIRRRIDIAVTLLPEPDSPTMASVSPAARSNETSSTALTMPRSVRNSVDRPLTLRRGAPIRRAPLHGWSRSIAQLLLQLLVDPHTGVDRAGTHRARAQLASVVLHPRPPRRVDVGRRQPDVRCEVEDLDGHLAQHLDAFLLVLGTIDLVHLRVVLRIGPARRIPLLASGEALADCRGRVGVAVVHHVADRHGARGHGAQERAVL